MVAWIVFSLLYIYFMNHFLSMMYPSTLMIADLFYWYLHCISFGWVWYFNYSCINFASNYCYVYLDKGRHWFNYRCQCGCFLYSHFDIFCDIIPWHVISQNLNDGYADLYMNMKVQVRQVCSGLEKICLLVTMEFACKLSVLDPMTCFSVTLFLVHYCLHFIDELNQHAYKYQIKSNWEKQNDFISIFDVIETENSLQCLLLFYDSLHSNLAFTLFDSEAVFSEEILTHNHIS